MNLCVVYIAGNFLKISVTIKFLRGAVPSGFGLLSYLNIQGVTGGTDQTSGGCSLGQTIPI